MDQSRIPIREARAQRAYSRVMESGGTKEEANAAAQKARNSRSGYYKNVPRRMHAQIRKSQLEKAWQNQVANHHGVAGHCMICEAEREERYFIIAEENDGTPIGCICIACHKARYPDYRLKVPHEVWQKIHFLESVPIKARLIWRLSNLPGEKVQAFIEYVTKLEIK